MSAKQLSFSDYLPASWDYGLETEVYRETGKRSLPDGHEIFMQLHRQRIDAWLAERPNSNIHDVLAACYFHTF